MSPGLIIETKSEEDEKSAISPDFLYRKSWFWTSSLSFLIGSRIGEAFED